MEQKELSVYSSINEIQLELSKVGITKDRKNEQQGYSFRGIDDVYNSLSPLLAKYKLCILPRIKDFKVREVPARNGGILNYATVVMDYDLVSSVDGSTHGITTIGEAMDSGDKAFNKAMSAAYKYAMFQTFAIPTEGDNDADATTHVRSAPVAKAPARVPVEESSSDDFSAQSDAQSTGIKNRQGAIDTVATMLAAAEALCLDLEGLKDFWNKNISVIDELDNSYPEQYQALRDGFVKIKQSFTTQTTTEEEGK